jgi:hypothetical protein
MIGLRATADRLHRRHEHMGGARLTVLAPTGGSFQPVGGWNDLPCVLYLQPDQVQPGDPPLQPRVTVRRSAIPDPGAIQRGWRGRVVLDGITYTYGILAVAPLNSLAAIYQLTFEAA